jgi:hypothetical protein
LLGPRLQLDLEHPFDGRRDVELDAATGLNVLADVVTVEVDLIADVRLDPEADVVALVEAQVLDTPTGFAFRTTMVGMVGFGLPLPPVAAWVVVVPESLSDPLSCKTMNRTTATTRATAAKTSPNLLDCICGT